MAQDFNFEEQAEKLRGEHTQLNAQKNQILQQRADLDRSLNALNVQMVRLQGKWELCMTALGKDLDGNPLVVPEKPKKEVKKPTVKKKPK